MGKLWDSFTGLADLKRAQSPLSAIPGACSLSCNNAYQEAQKKGKTPALCDSRSTFQQSLRSCTTCIADENDDPFSDRTGCDATDETRNLEPYIHYCAQLNPEGQAASITSLLHARALYSDPELLAKRQAIAYSDEASFVSFPDETSFVDSATLAWTTTSTLPTFTMASPTVTSQSTTSQTAIAQPSSATTQDSSAAAVSSSPKLGVIIPAIVVPIVVLNIVAIAVFLFVRRRRKQKRTTAAAPELTNASEYTGKPELHGDAFRPELHAEGVQKTAEKPELHGDAVRPELQGDGVSNKPDGTAGMAELPAGEPVGSEVDAREQGKA